MSVFPGPGQTTGFMPASPPDINFVIWLLQNPQVALMVQSGQADINTVYGVYQNALRTSGNQPGGPGTLPGGLGAIFGGTPPAAAAAPFAGGPAATIPLGGNGGGSAQDRSPKPGTGGVSGPVSPLAIFGTLNPQLGAILAAIGAYGKPQTGLYGGVTGGGSRAAEANQPGGPDLAKAQAALATAAAARARGDWNTAMQQAALADQYAGGVLGLGDPTGIGARSDAARSDIASAAAAASRGSGAPGGGYSGGLATGAAEFEASTHGF